MESRSVRQRVPSMAVHAAQAIRFPAPMIAATGMNSPNARQIHTMVADVCGSVMTVRTWLSKTAIPIPSRRTNNHRSWPPSSLPPGVPYPARYQAFWRTPPLSAARTQVTRQPSASIQGPQRSPFCPSPIATVIVDQP